MIMKAENLLLLKRLFPKSFEWVRVSEIEEENKTLPEPIPPPPVEIELKIHRKVVSTK